MSERAGDAPEQIAFLLLPEFPIYALVLAREALRVANQNAGQRLFSTRLFSTDGAPVRAGDGTELAVDSGIAAVPFFPTVIVVAGNRPTQHITRPLLSWLRRLARHGALLGAVDTGAFTLAAAACSTATGSRCTGKRSPCSASTTPRSRPSSSSSPSTATG
jgi:transcriptional regulator GlxA family with amidase domain